MNQHTYSGQAAPAGSFPTDPAGRPEATRPALVEVADGGDLHLRIGPMAHCHIAEHMQSGMMFSFTVARKEAIR